MNEQSFEETYAQMMDGELARTLRSRRTLVPEARAALDQEIQKRQLDPEELRKRRPRNIDGPKHPMEVEKRLKNKRIPFPWLIVLIVLSIALIASLYHFHVPQLYFPIWITILVPSCTVWGFWELKNRLWFWAIIGFITAANIAIFSVMGWPWGTHWVPAHSIAGLCTLESIPIFALIARIQKRMNRRQDESANHSTSARHPAQAGKIDRNPS
jgi:hypothetical protein